MARIMRRLPNPPLPHLRSHRRARASARDTAWLADRRFVSDIAPPPKPVYSPSSQYTILSPLVLRRCLLVAFRLNLTPKIIIGNATSGAYLLARLMQDRLKALRVGHRQAL